MRLMRDEVFVSVVLRVGVALAALASLVGALVYFSAPTQTLADFATFHAVHIAPGFSGIGLLSLGVAILIATPIVRVAILVILFLRERDWLYTTISAFVLGVLLLSLNG